MSEREIGKFLSTKRMNVSGFTTLYAFPDRFVFEQIPDLSKREIIRAIRRPWKEPL
jgi:hypothetical protein